MIIPNSGMKCAPLCQEITNTTLKEEKMKNNFSLKLIILTTFLSFFFLIGCNEEDTILISDMDNGEIVSELNKIVANDEALQSFNLNYNEEEAMSFMLGKSATEIYPVRVGQKMNLINRNLSLEIVGDTAYGLLTLDYEGMLFILASEDSIYWGKDSLILKTFEKQFSTTIKRNLVFAKKDSAINPLNEWKIVSVSLAEGGTLTENISIENVKVKLPNGEIIEIDSPLDYYLSRNESFHQFIPQLIQFQSVEVEVTIKSIYQEEDFVTITHGAVKTFKNMRQKRKLNLESENFDGTYYHRTYKNTWVVNQFKGFKHAIINAFPQKVIKDSEFPVESKSWGIPYFVK